MINFTPSIWGKALTGMPKIDPSTWHSMDIIARWLVATRAAAFIMTFSSAAIAGLLAQKAGAFDWGTWILLTLGLCLAHGCNNILNDLTDSWKGVDKGNYFRNQYGVQPIEEGLLSVRQSLTYFVVTGILAMICAFLLWQKHGDVVIWLTLIGSFFVLFYTWPLKYYGMGEPTLFLVWGPLMIGGGYYLMAGEINWQVLLAASCYGLAPTAVLFGKHTDKLYADKAKGIYTLPVILGHKASRITTFFLFAIQLPMIVVLVIDGYFSPVLLITLALIPSLMQMYKLVLAEPPQTVDDVQDPRLKAVWPLYYVAGSFGYMRRFSGLLLLALIVDVFFFS